MDFLSQHVIQPTGQLTCEEKGLLLLGAGRLRHAVTLRAGGGEASSGRIRDQILVVRAALRMFENRDLRERAARRLRLENPRPAAGAEPRYKCPRNFGAKVLITGWLASFLPLINRFIIPFP